MSVQEVKRWFAVALSPLRRRWEALLHWSLWRRRHQALAMFYHFRARKALCHLQL